MQSLWTIQKPKEYNKLNGNVKTDVLIIGGGMAGILCAYYLKQAGVDSILVEGDRIGCGVTQNTTAKITLQHGLIYHQLIQNLGREQALKYLHANQQALDTYRELCQAIDCDFENKSAFIYSRTDRKAIEAEVHAMEKLNYHARFLKTTPLPVDIAGAVRIMDQAQFHPLKFLYEIARDLKIYEHTYVRELGKNMAMTDSGKIMADNIIITSHFPFLNKHGSYFLKMYQHRSYAITLKNAQDVHGMHLEETKDGLSFRNHKDLLIIGGGDHRTGRSGGNWKVLRKFAAKAYPQAKEVRAWATQDCMTLDDIPYIGRYSANTEGLYVATGFNKWGMTSSMVAARLLTDLVCNRQNDYTDLFSPSRSILKPQLFVNGLNAAAGILVPAKRRCPHLGCALKWNSAERTWDCPCHGSRFEHDGKLIENPATGDLK